MMMPIPNGWPDDLRPAFEIATSEMMPRKRLEMLNTIKQFCVWCEVNHMPIAINRLSCRAFETHLRRKVAVSVANQKLRHLYSVGIAGPDLEARDWLFDNHRDSRRTNDILSGPWWPNIPRVLACSLTLSDRRRVLQEVDNFFRWRQRTRGVPQSLPLRSLFLSEDISDQTRYHRLSRLCVGLDAILPGDADLVGLRDIQKNLYSTVWPRGKSERPAARRIPEVEDLLATHQWTESGDCIAEETKRNRRAVLNLHFDLLAEAGRPLAFDKHSLDLFADYARTKHELWRRVCQAPQEFGETERTSHGWRSRSVASKCGHLVPFIPDPILRRAWSRFAESYAKLARSRGEPKVKELALAARPMDLTSLYQVAEDLLRKADGEVNVQVREGMFLVLGALGVLLFYPLRRGDLLKLRLGQHLIRDARNWLLAPGPTLKTGTRVETLLMPREATPFLDAALLRGARREQLSEIYLRRQGEAYFKSPRTEVALTGSGFSDLFKRWVGHTPHLIRTLWCEELIKRGADRIIISAMLQHKSLISQQDYEVIAGKIRRARAVEAIRAISDELLLA